MCGLYYVAYFERTKRYRRVRPIYLWNGNSSVEFVDWPNSRGSARSNSPE
ncbi:hypothetical protein [Methanopyrus sp.]